MSMESGVDFAVFETILGSADPIVAGHCASKGPNVYAQSVALVFDELVRTWFGIVILGGETADWSTLADGDGLAMNLGDDGGGRPNALNCPN